MSSPHDLQNNSSPEASLSRYRSRSRERASQPHNSEDIAVNPRSYQTSSDRSQSRSRSRENRYRRSGQESRSPRNIRRRRDSRSRSHSQEQQRPSRRYNDRGREDPKPNRCLGVFGLNLGTTQRELRQIFSEYGQLKDVKVVLDAKTGRSRGFAFVYYERIEDATDARKSCSGMTIGGREIRADYSVTQRAHTPTPGIYMGRSTYSSSYGGSGGASRRGGSRYGGGGGSGGYGHSDRRRSRSPRRRSFRSRSRSHHKSRSISPQRSRSRSHQRSHYPYDRRH